MGEVILIVEADPKNPKLLRDVLKVNGYATLEATNGAHGVNLAKPIFNTSENLIGFAVVSKMSGSGSFSVLMK